MSLHVEDINGLPILEKVELYKLLQADEELKNFLAFEDNLFEELAQRDKAFEEGKIRLSTRQQLTERLKNRRNAL